jgi:thiamine-phosphate pyrophosphorylase
MKKASRFGPWPHTTTNGLPCLWLFTDERVPVDLSVLPRGAGVVIRHYNHADRADFVRTLVAEGKARGLTMLVAGDMRLALASGADGVHLPEYQVRFIRKPYRSFIITAAAHTRRALLRARYVDGVFLSPLFATQSHSGAKPLGAVHATRLIRSPSPSGREAHIFALGGITPQNVKQLAALGFAGIAAIDGWMNKSSDVPESPDLAFGKSEDSGTSVKLQASF